MTDPTASRYYRFRNSYAADYTELTNTKTMIDRILFWNTHCTARPRKFNMDIVSSIRDWLEDHGDLTVSQRKAILNIYMGFKVESWWSRVGWTFPDAPAARLSDS